MSHTLRVCDLTTLFLDRGGSGGGVNTYLEEKARHLGRQPGVVHDIVVPGARDEVGTLHGATVHRLRSPRLPWNREHRVLWRFGRVRRLLRQLQPDVVEVDCVHLLGRTAARALPAVPIVGVYHVHLPTFIAGDAATRFGRRFATLVERCAWRWVQDRTRPCRRVVVTSPDMHRRLLPRLPNLEYVPLGVNSELFRPRPPTARTGRRLLYVGRLSPEKDLESLLAAHRLLAAQPEFADCELHLVGDGPLRERLARLGGGRVHMHRSIPYGEQLAEIYATADVFVNPSPNETFGLACLEAAACGVPVVAIARGGTGDVITPDLGLLAAPGSAAELADRIRTALRQPGQFAGGRQRVVRDFPWSRCFDHLLMLYRRLLQAPVPVAVGLARCAAGGPSLPVEHRE